MILSGTPVDFKKLLDESHIAEYAESLHVTKDARDLISLSSSRSRHGQNGQATFAGCTGMVPCSTYLILHRLKAIIIQYGRELSQAGSTSIHFLRQPSLHFVRFHSAPCPIVSLDRLIGANVKHLINRHTFVEKWHASPSDPHPQTLPVYLVIDRPTTLVGMLFADPTRRIQPNSLQKLVVITSTSSLDREHCATWAILQTCSDTLEILNLRLRGN